MPVLDALFHDGRGEYIASVGNTATELDRRLCRWRIPSLCKTCVIKTLPHRSHTTRPIHAMLDDWLRLFLDDAAKTSTLNSIGIVYDSQQMGADRF